MRPKIAVTVFTGLDNEWQCIRNNYIECIIKEGGLPIIVPLTFSYNILDEIIKDIEGIVFTGGFDINPIYYKKDIIINKSKVKNYVDIRDEEELYIMQKAMETNKSILGICRGCQLINVYNGGTLYEDIPSQFKTNLIHEQKENYDKGIHEVFIENKSKLYSAIKKEKLFVNSMHHQGIKDVGNNLIINARSQDGFIEGIESTDSKFVLGIQWHPEYIYNCDYAQKLIFKNFIESCKK